METVNSGWGFHSQERETSELEKVLKVHLNEDNTVESVIKQGDVYLNLTIGDSNVTGKYIGTTSDGYHVIKPTTFPTASFFTNPQASQKEKLTWLDAPRFVKGPIIQFLPVSREVLEAIASGFDELEKEIN